MSVAHAQSRVTTLAERESRHPVIEVFGPTVQGEGPDAGLPCYFVRFGACDYRCAWCDSMYAVEPREVRRNAARLTAAAIAERLGALRPPPAPGHLVVLSGGNPALHRLERLVALLQARALRVSVETQGSRWRPWLAAVDRLVISPKPPSSDMATARHARQLDDFYRLAVEAARGYGPAWAATKIVVFDDADLAWATQFWRAHPSFPLYLSAGTPYRDGAPPLPDAALKQAVQERYRWLCERVAREPALARAKVLPQLHVLAWGSARAV
jgi:7-carboxy-7-deazaguanine synthase